MDLPLDVAWSPFARAAPAEGELFRRAQGFMLPAFTQTIKPRPGEAGHKGWITLTGPVYHILS